jgi:hypothetical protein
MRLDETNSNRLTSTLAWLLQTAVKMLVQHFNMEVVLLTGGLATMQETRGAVESLQRGGSDVEFWTSDQPIYDGALGAAIASSRAASCQEKEY